MNKLLLLILGLLIISIGCSPSSAGNENISLAEKEFRSNCQTCHMLPKAKAKSDEDWPIIVNRYGKKAKLSQEQITRITDFLIENN